MTTLRVLTPEEIAVFDQIVAQREKKGPSQDHFVYFASIGQKELQSSGKATNLGIGIQEQAAIIHRLAEDGIIEADWITSHDASGFTLRHHDFKWVEANYSVSDWDGLFINEGGYSDYFFVHLSFDHIKAINDNCKAVYPCGQEIHRNAGVDAGDSCHSDRSG